MATGSVTLPPGFVLDEPEIEAQTPSELPEGFVLDAPVQPPEGFVLDEQPTDIPLMEEEAFGTEFTPASGAETTVAAPELDPEERGAGEIAADIAGTIPVGGAGVPANIATTLAAQGEVLQKAQQVMEAHPVATAVVKSAVPQVAGALEAVKVGGKPVGKALEFVGKAASDFWVKAQKTTRGKLISEKGRKSTHPAWIISSSIAETTPQLIADYITGRVGGKLAEGATSLVTSSVEGNTAGASQKRTVEEAILGMTDEELVQLPVFAEAMEKADNNIEKAREIAAKTASNRAYATTFLTTTMTSLALDRVGAGTLDKWLQDPKLASMGMKKILGLAGMEATEEGIQSGFEKIVENRNTGKPIMEGVMEAMGYGAATGSILGAAIPGVGRAAQQADARARDAQEAPEVAPEVIEPAVAPEAVLEPSVAPEEDITPEPQRPGQEAVPDTGEVKAEADGVELEKEAVKQPTKEEIDEQVVVTGSLEEKRAKLSEISRNKEKAAQDAQKRRDTTIVDESLAVFKDEFPRVKTPEKGDFGFEDIVRERDRKGRFTEGQANIPTDKKVTVTWEDALSRAKALGLVEESATGPEALVPLYQGTIRTMADVEGDFEARDVAAFEGLIFDEMVQDVENGIRPPQELITEAPAVWDAVLRETGVDENGLEETLKFEEELFDAETEEIAFEDIQQEREEVIAKEDKDAVQVRETKKVPVQPEAGRGKEVRKAQEAAKPSKPKEKVKKAPEPSDVKEGEKVAGLSKEVIGRVRDQAGQMGLDKGATETWIASVEEARAEGLDKKASVIANDILTTDRRVSRPEQVGLAERMGQAEVELETVNDRIDKDTEAGRTPDITDIEHAEQLDAELDLITRAIDSLGTETGRDLNFKKLLLKRVENFSLAKLRRDALKGKARVAKKGEKVTLNEKEEAELKEVAKKIREAKAELAEIEKKAVEIQAQTMEQLANQAFEQESLAAKKTRRRKETLKRERVALKAEIAALGYKVNDITGVPFEVSRILTKLAVNHIEDGARSLSEVVERIQKDIPDVDAEDIFNSFGGRVKSEIKKATTETQKVIKDLKGQARRLGEINEIMTKGKDVKDIKTRNLSKENADLQAALSELREVAYASELDDAKLEDIVNRIQKIKDQTERGYRDVTDPPRPDSAEVKEARRELKNVRDIQKAVDIIASLEEDIKTGNLQDTTRKQSLVISDELSRLKRRISNLKGVKRHDKRVAALKLTIDGLKAQLVTGERTKLAQRLEENRDIRTAQREIKELRDIMRTEDAIKNLEQQIETGIFDVPPQRQQRIISDELERKRVKLNKLKKEARNTVASMQPMTVGEKAKEVLINMPRTLLATGDMSGTLRQGLLLSARRPVTASKAFGTSFKAFWSDHTAESVDLALKSSPMQRTRERAGLFLAGVNEAMSSREEAFMSRVVETKFAKAIGLNAVVRASERHMVTHLNLLRASIFDSYAQSNPTASTEELAAFADYINKASGRGDLGKFSGGAKDLANVLFAPRFTVSRFQTPAALAKNIKQNPRVAKEIGKDFIGLGALAAAVMFLAKMAGADVGDDPEDADWGKLIIGNTRIDLFGGFLQPARLGALLYYQAAGRAGLLKKVDPETGEIKVRDAKVSFKDALFRFSQYKLSPPVQLAFELLEGKDVVGKPVSPPESVIRKMVPIVAQGAFDTVKQGKVKESLFTVPLEFFGAGVNVYENEMQAPDIKRVLNNADYTPSPPRYPEWVKHKVKAEYDIVFGQLMASAIRAEGLTDKEDLQDAAAEIRKEMLSEIPE
jgi:hypothetical protein